VRKAVLGPLLCVTPFREFYLWRGNNILSGNLARSYNKSDFSAITITKEQASTCSFFLNISLYLQGNWFNMEAGSIGYFRQHFS
jgi:hypothetical protein